MLAKTEGAADLIDATLFDTPETATEAPLWAPIEGEPSSSYLCFAIFLSMGPERRITRAVEQYVKAVKPKNNFVTIVHSWVAWATTYKWYERVYAYDMYQASQVVNSTNIAYMKLRMAAPKAADALIKALTAPGQEVKAANSILDRVGVIAVKGTSQIPADRSKANLTDDELLAIALSGGSGASAPHETQGS